jgi:DNA repair exonuclease SbcCD ATPase subunit
MGYFATRYFETKHKSEAQVLTISDLRDEVTELEGDILRLQQKIADQRTSISEKDSLIELRDKRIATLRNKLSIAEKSGRLKGKEITEVQNRLTLVQNQLQNYESQIASLERNVSQLKQQIYEEQTLIVRQESTLYALNEENEAQAQRLEQAALLQAADFQFFRVKKSGKEVMGSSFRRGKLGVLKVCFQLLPNAEAKEGPRPIKLQVSHSENGLTKTVQTQAMYSHEGQRVCIPITMPESVEEGEYMASVLDKNGHVLGSERFEVR